MPSKLELTKKVGEQALRDAQRREVLAFLLYTAANVGLASKPGDAPLDKAFTCCLDPWRKDEQSRRDYRLKADALIKASEKAGIGLVDINHDDLDKACRQLTVIPAREAYRLGD